MSEDMEHAPAAIDCWARCAQERASATVPHDGSLFVIGGHKNSQPRRDAGSDRAAGVGSGAWRLRAEPEIGIEFVDVERDRQPGQRDRLARPPIR